MNADPTDSIPVSDAGELVRMRRDRLGASQEEVAEQAGVNRDTVSAVEHGTSSAKSRVLVTQALSRMEDEAGLTPIGDEPLVRRVEPVEGAPQLVRIQVPGLYGGKAIIVEGPIDNPEALAATVDAILRRLSGGPDVTTSE
jgi:DNA-binding XRE family transcriptional regulator